MEGSEIVALDLGAKHTGMARGNSNAKLAEPLKSVPTDSVIKEISGLGADAVVVGLPRGLDGQDTAQTVWVRQWVDTARAKLSTPFYWQDEALTSAQAQQIKKSGADEHALAAAVILQDFLDSSEAERVLC